MWLNLVQLRSWAGSAFSLPGLLIIGAQRAGTSSLFTYLSEHPQLHRSLRKETEFFTRGYSEGEAWYRAHFPSRLRLALDRRRHGSAIGFEATPDYLLAPLAACRAHAMLPEARIVCLLRDPVERAFSHYRHMRRLGFERLEFEQALDAEEERTARGWQDLSLGHQSIDPAILRFSYTRRGLYAEQVERWLREFGESQVLVLWADEFFHEPRRGVDRVLSFVGVPPTRQRHFRNRSYPDGPPEPAEIPTHLRRRLDAFFDPHDQRLAELLGEAPTWRR